MIGLSDVFGMIGQGDCSDVATSLRDMGTTGSSMEYSIPIYECFYLKFLPGGKTGFLCGNIQEYNVLRGLCMNCGAMACCINLLDQDILTLFGLFCLYTPNTGMTVFYKNNIPELVDMTEEIADQLANLAGIPFDLNYGALDLASEALDILINKFMEKLQEDLGQRGISLRSWDDIPAFDQEITQSGEKMRMFRFRKQTQAQIL